MGDVKFTEKVVLPNLPISICTPINAHSQPARTGQASRDDPKTAKAMSVRSWRSRLRRCNTASVTATVAVATLVYFAATSVNKGHGRDEIGQQIHRPHRQHEPRVTEQNALETKEDEEAMSREKVRKRFGFDDHPHSNHVNDAKGSRGKNLCSGDPGLESWRETAHLLMLHVIIGEV